MEIAAPAKKSDLSVRILSAVVMLAVAGGALWLGGMVWTVFVLLVGVGVWFEWSTLVLLFKPPGAGRGIWRAAGAIYCGIAAAMLLEMRELGDGIVTVLLIVGSVIATDVSAYFAGRAIGGPKIAPAISPSKTWAGLVGGMIGAALLVYGAFFLFNWPSDFTVGHAGFGPAQPKPGNNEMWFVVGALIAIVAQAGDFFESWMKRRAGVKDSGNLIPGHGGLFDRVDGLLAVCFVLGVLSVVSRLWGGL